MDSTFQIPTHDTLLLRLNQIEHADVFQEKLYPRLLACAGKQLTFQDAVMTFMHALNAQNSWLKDHERFDEVQIPITHILTIFLGDAGVAMNMTALLRQYALKQDDAIFERQDVT